MLFFWSGPSPHHHPPESPHAHAPGTPNDSLFKQTRVLNSLGSARRARVRNAIPHGIGCVTRSSYAHGVRCPVDHLTGGLLGVRLECTER